MITRSMARKRKLQEPDVATKGSATEESSSKKFKAQQSEQLEISKDVQERNEDDPICLPDERPPEGETGPSIHRSSDSTDSLTSEEADQSEDPVQLSDKIWMFPNKRISNHGEIFGGELRSGTYGSRQIVLKLVPNIKESITEAKIHAKLGNHSHILSMIHSDVCPNDPFRRIYIALDKCHKENLRGFIENRKIQGIPFDSDLAIEFCKQLVLGVTYIHENKIIHKDIKPENIFLSLNQKTIKIADFGLSQEIDSVSAVVFMKQQFGTDGFRPIESFGRSKISQKSDIFSLGATFYFILSDGEHPFGDDFDILNHNIRNSIFDLSKLLVSNVKTVQHLIKHMIAPKLNDRPTIWQVSEHPCWTGKEVSCDFGYHCEESSQSPDSSDEEEPVRILRDCHAIQALLDKICVQNEAVILCEENTAFPTSFEGPVLGIDLGASYSCVAVLQGESVEVINHERDRRTMPSYVSFEENSELVGWEAWYVSHTNLENTIYGMKKIIGLPFSDPIVQEQKEKWAFEVVNVEGKAAVKIKADAKVIYPEEIIARILAHMKQKAEDHIGEKIHKAVIAVPACFHDSQRTAVKNAAATVGFHALALRDPMAVALAVQRQQTVKSQRTIFIFDLGGGAFDAAVITMEDDGLNVKATGGDRNIGGESFTQRFFDYCAKQFEMKYGKLIQSERERHNLMMQCDEAKRELSEISANDSTSVFADPLAGGLDLELRVTRPLFEEINKELFDRALDIVKQVLANARLDKEEIDDVILAGGSTRIPYLQEMLQDYFGDKIRSSINPDEVVAIGAAIHGSKVELRLKKEQKYRFTGGDKVVRNVKASKGDQNPERCVIVTFDSPVKGPASLYKIIAVPERGMKQTVHSKTENVMVEHLRKGAKYKFEVYARWEDVWSEGATSNFIYTDADPIAPVYNTRVEDLGRVKNLMCHLTSNGPKDLMTLRWVAPSFDSRSSDYKAEGYKVEVWKRDDNGHKRLLEVVKHVHTETVQLDLELGEAYECAVSAIHWNIDEDFTFTSSAVQGMVVHTGPCAPVCIRNDVTDDTLTIEWNEAKGAESYALQLCAGNPPREIFHEDLAKETIYHRKFDEHFGYGTTYYAVIFAIGAAPWHSSASYRTTEKTIPKQ